MRIKIVALLISSFLLIGTVLGGTNSVYADNLSVVEPSTIKVMHNGDPVELQTVLHNGKLFAPIRDLCRALGCGLEVDLGKRMITLEQIALEQTNEMPEPSGYVLPILPEKLQTISWSLNPYQIKLNGMDTLLETLFTEGTNFVPVRYTAELLNKSITWDEESKSVAIDDIPVDSVGSVNDIPVSMHYYSYYLDSAIKSETEQREDGQLSEEDKERIQAEIFQNVAERILLLQKALEQGIELNENDLSMMNSNVLATVNNYGGIDPYRAILKQNQVTFYESVLMFQESLLINKFLNTLLTDVQASEEDILEFYAANEEEFTQPEQRKAKHILLSFEEDTAEHKEEIKIAAQDVLDRLNAGENFDELMLELSTDPGLEANPDGYTFGRGQMVPEFEEAAFSMSAGEVSELVETDFGYHILKLEEVIPAALVPLDEVKDSIKNHLDASAKDQYVQELIAKWKEESLIEFEPLL